VKQFFAGALVGVVAAGLFFYLPTKTKAPEDVKVTQVSGEKITHNGFNYTSGSITFSTKAEGKGEIITEIPKTKIPEAKAWIYNTNAVMAEFILTERRMYGATYMRRWSNFSVGGGVVVSEKKFEGIKLQTQYWFKL